MKNIGMFYGNRFDMRDAFEAHANRVDPIHFNCPVSVNPRSQTITIGDTRYMYYAFTKDGEAMQKIQGINFDAMFSENLNPYCKRYVMTRFRPGLNK